MVPIKLLPNRLDCKERNLDELYRQSVSITAPILTQRLVKNEINENEPEEYSEFSKLNISTITVNIMTNIQFNLAEIYSLIIRLASYDKTSLLNQKIEISQAQHKKLQYPKGTISYINYNGDWRGIRKKPNKEKEKRIKEKKKRNDFINQTTIDIFTDTNRRINVMIFKNGKLKLAGCRHSNDAIIATFYLWDIISKNDTSYRMLENMDSYGLRTINDIECPAFLYTNEMINISFQFPFSVDKIKVNNLFNSISDNCVSLYEQTGRQYVTVHLSSKIDDKVAILLQQLGDETYHFSTPVHEMKKIPKTCFMVFDKRVIMSGIDYPTMNLHYVRFIDIISKNVDKVKLGA
jgi:hypothetical protein